jgi:exodeoxyribonuclease V gamma subunit
LLYLYQSNQLETLCGALNRILEDPVGRPLQPDRVVVLNPGMARWLSQQIANRRGIAANLEFPLPASFIWEMFDLTLSGQTDLSAFRQEVLLWKVVDQLTELADESVMTKVSAYLVDDRDGNKLFQLAKEIASLFDQYLIYRPKMILYW